MQKIKRCPKCSGVPIDINTKICPFDGTPLVEQSSKPEQSFIPLNQSVPLNYYLLRAGIAIVVLFAIALFLRPSQPNSFSDKNQLATVSNVNKIVNSGATQTPSESPLSSSLSSKENLEAGKKALVKGDLSAARNHLSAIPKDSQEYDSAKQLLTKLEAREQRKKIEDELKDIQIKEANVEEMMNQTEHMLDGEGTIGKSIYLNALKKKGELQLQRIKLERKLKKMP